MTSRVYCVIAKLSLRSTTTAWRMHRGLLPNVVLLDLLMPGMDGLQTLESCRKIRPDQKVVMMSCVNDTGKVVQAIKLGASDYITKPFQPAQLQGAVRSALNANQTGPAQPPKDANNPVETIETLDD